MKSILVLIYLSLLIVIQSAHAAFRYQTLTYEQILAQWRERVQTDPRLKEHKSDTLQNLPTDLDCGKNPCEFPVFEFTGQNVTEKTPTIFLVAGFHGNQQLGVLILHYFYEKMKDGHAIILPIANPSGFFHGVREEWPSEIDANRDFPFATEQTTCMRSATARVIDYIHRTWKIDSVITLHAGEDSVSWNWGFAQKQGIETEDDIIYRQIGQSMKRQAGSNMAIAMPKIRIGNMNDVVYPVQGSYEDWAYAAPWAKEYASKCADYLGYPAYPQHMGKTLVFLFESGPQQINSSAILGSRSCPQDRPNINNRCNGYVNRGIRVLQVLFDAAFPKVLIRKISHNLEFTVRGCKSAYLVLKIEGKSFSSYLNGSLSAHPSGYLLPLKDIRLQKGRNERIQYDLTCDSQWRSLGKTVFGKARNFQGTL